MSELEGRLLAAAVLAARAWVDMGAVSQGSLRRQWPTLAGALDDLTDGGRERYRSTTGADAEGKALSSGELEAIGDRYRTSPWALPPTLRR